MDFKKTEKIMEVSDHRRDKWVDNLSVHKDTSW